MESRIDNVRDRSRAASREIRRFIEDCIQNGSLTSGDKIPNERDLADQFGAGRNTIRKVLIALETEGVVERHVGRGTFIKNSPVRIRPDISNGSSATEITGAEPGIADFVRRVGPLDLMELRIAVEPFFAQHCALRASLDEISRMQHAIDRSRVAASLWEFENCDDELHREIAAASRNPLFVGIAEIITSVRTSGEWGLLKERTLSEQQKALHTQEHVAIVAAIRQRDPIGAKREMETHLKSVLDGMLQVSARSTR